MNTSVVQAECPACKASLRVPSEWLGRVVRCKQCEKKFKVAAGAAENRRDAPVSSVPPPVVRKSASPRPIVEPLPPALPPSFPAPLVEPLPADAKGSVPVPPKPDGFIPAFAAGGKYKNKGQYRPGRGSGMWKWALLVVLLLTGAGGWYATIHFMKKKNNSQEVVEDGATKPKPGNAAIHNATAGPFPRRMLAISVQNYLFANPLLNGDRFARAEVDRTDFAAIASKAASRWHVPDSQLYVLTDGKAPKFVTDPYGDASAKPAAPKATPERVPMKEVIEKTIELFCDTSREQDRVVLLIACHAIEKEGKAYLTPMEGDFDEVETLVPLDFVYDKIGKCKAQQKLVVFDVCRFDPVSGAERPNGGQMSEELAKALHSPPEGVAVWTSCSPGEYSYEYESASLMRDGRERYVSGSVFLYDVQKAANRGKLYTDPKKGGGLQAPAEPIPVEPLVNYVDKEVSEFVKDYEAKATQTPKFTPATGAKSVEYNPDAKLATRFQIPPPREGAAKEEVAAIFSEVSLPPIKLEKGGASIAKQAADFPFRKEALEGYLSDGVTVEEIKKKPDKWPLRFAVVDAVEKARVILEEKDGDDALPEKLFNTASDTAKAQILRQQRIPTLRRDELRDILDVLVALAPKRDEEKSKRWQANYDYVVGEFKMRIAYLEEFNLAYGKVRKDELPELDPAKGHRGWVLAATTKMAVTRDMKDLADEGRDRLVDLAKSNPHTPWALLAKRDKGVVLGLRWEPFSDGTPSEEMPAKKAE